jgi:hypothetical protein
MAASLRGVCAALGRTGSVSLCRDILGFSGSKIPAAPNNTRPVPVLNINKFVRLLRGKHFHVHLIFAGSELFTNNDMRRMDYEVFRLRDIYAAAGIGIGIITMERRTAANSAGHAVVRTRADVERTGHDITADGDFIPVVVPADMTPNLTAADGSIKPGLGKSPLKGPCSPRNEVDMNSVVVNFDGDPSSRTLAHEVGHFLGADHPTTPGTNLMAQNADFPGDSFFATTIIESDRNKMLAHPCVIRPGLAGI